MIRCQAEITESMLDKKQDERRDRPFVAMRRLTFEALLSRDASEWRLVESADALRRAAERARKELVQGDFDRFVRWVCGVHGTGLARAAGLPIAPLRVELAS